MVIEVEQIIAATGKVHAWAVVETISGQQVLILGRSTALELWKFDGGEFHDMSTFKLFFSSSDIFGVNDLITAILPLTSFLGEVFILTKNFRWFVCELRESTLCPIAIILEGKFEYGANSKKTRFLRICQQSVPACTSGESRTTIAVTLQESAVTFLTLKRTETTLSRKLCWTLNKSEHSLIPSHWGIADDTTAFAAEETAIFLASRLDLISESSLDRSQQLVDRDTRQAQPLNGCEILHMVFRDQSSSTAISVDEPMVAHLVILHRCCSISLDASNTSGCFIRCVHYSPPTGLHSDFGLSNVPYLSHLVAIPQQKLPTVDDAGAVLCSSDSCQLILGTKSILSSRNFERASIVPEQDYKKMYDYEWSPMNTILLALPPECSSSTHLKTIVISLRSSGRNFNLTEVCAIITKPGEISMTTFELTGTDGARFSQILSFKTEHDSLFIVGLATNNEILLLNISLTQRVSSVQSRFGGVDSVVTCVADLNLLDRSLAARCQVEDKTTWFDEIILPRRLAVCSGTERTGKLSVFTQGLEVSLTAATECDLGFAPGAVLALAFSRPSTTKAKLQRAPYLFFPRTHVLIFTNPGDGPVQIVEVHENDDMVIVEAMQNSGLAKCLDTTRGIISLQYIFLPETKSRRGHLSDRRFEPALVVLTSKSVRVVTIDGLRLLTEWHPPLHERLVAMAFPPGCECQSPDIKRSQIRLAIVSIPQEKSVDDESGITPPAKVSKVTILRLGLAAEFDVNSLCIVSVSTVEFERSISKIALYTSEETCCNPVESIPAVSKNDNMSCTAVLVLSFWEGARTPAVELEVIVIELGTAIGARSPKRVVCTLSIPRPLIDDISDFECAATIVSIALCALSSLESIQPLIFVGFADGQILVVEWKLKVLTEGDQGHATLVRRQYFKVGNYPSTLLRPLSIDNGGVRLHAIMVGGSECQSIIFARDGQLLCCDIRKLNVRFESSTAQCFSFCAFFEQSLGLSSMTQLIWVDNRGNLIIGEVDLGQIHVCPKLPMLCIHCAPLQGRATNMIIMPHLNAILVSVENVESGSNLRLFDIGSCREMWSSAVSEGSIVTGLSLAPAPPFACVSTASSGTNFGEEGGDRWQVAAIATNKLEFPDEPHSKISVSFLELRCSVSCDEQTRAPISRVLGAVRWKGQYSLLGLVSLVRDPSISQVVASSGNELVLLCWGAVAKREQTKYQLSATKAARTPTGGQITALSTHASIVAVAERLGLFLVYNFVSPRSPLVLIARYSSEAQVTCCVLVVPRFRREEVQHYQSSHECAEILETPELPAGNLLSSFRFFALDRLNRSVSVYSIEIIDTNDGLENSFLIPSLPYEIGDSCSSYHELFTPSKKATAASDSANVVGLKKVLSIMIHPCTTSMTSCTRGNALATDILLVDAGGGLSSLNLPQEPRQSKQTEHFFSSYRRGTLDS